MRKKAFTLTELIVVISIISLLMAILMPVLAVARQQSRTVVCLSNMRQLVIAASLYANNNDGYYPIAYTYEIKHPQIVLYAWDFTSKKDWSTGEEKVMPGLLWQSDTIEKIQQCPAFKGGHNWLDDPYTGYNYNTSYIGHGSGESIVMPEKVIKVERPCDCVLFGDGQHGDGANKFMRAPFANPGDAGFSGRFAGAQGFRHLGKTNVAFCDGHVQSWGDCYTESYPNDKSNLEKHNAKHNIKIGFLSSDNSAYDLE